MNISDDQIYAAKSYLKFYKLCMKNNEQMPDDGLCLSLPSVLNNKLHKRERDRDYGYWNETSLIDFFEPTEDDLNNHLALDKNYWGNTEFCSYNNKNPEKAFNTLRQTIVLFMAAIEGEFDKKKRKKS